ncbi:protein-disulfide reductase DsbD [Solimonas sp. SE-A11]|uniref:protein-disulfide reductase DsbD family protein n=1 Tax=Solimonas sp. SE-A11 TaxID=3054954 RepID=UPI00259D2BC6|nr:thioredoxin family protein [Solimonas sp. SE-A11]MDM4770385.1 protein-disulfide reductase DsbD family protein [Solimonas sp. SE-A11]
MNIRRLAAACLLALGPAAAFAAPVQADHVVADLVAENQGLQPGGVANRVALRLQPDKGWHVYWLNPGDSGIPTSLQWTLPAGVEAGPIEWPYPHAHSLGDLTNYGYGEETLHLVPMKLGDAWTPGQQVTLQAEAKWLVCKDVCIPGKAALSLTLPVQASPQPDPAWAAAFAKARAELPQPTPGWQARFAVANGSVTLGIDGMPAHADRVEFFPEPNDLVNHAAPQRIDADGSGSLRLSQGLSSYFVEAPAELRGVLVLHEGGEVRAYQLQAVPGAVAAVPEAAKPAVDPGKESTAPTTPPSMLLVLASALLGGLILNLMPCVFPVLSLKALSLMQSRGQSNGEARRQALAYTAGVIVSFLAVAGLLLALRAGGKAIGWGFQLQSPAFIGLLTYLLLALGLSLSGAVNFGTRWMGVGQGLTQKSGSAGAFFTGVLAVVVASPCTVPFMGSAVGYAMTQGGAVTLLVFAALGLGLALPFLLLGFFPRLAAWLPRPGAWMETFKQAMAFPLYLTVAWLLWVLARQAGANAVGLVMLGMVLVAFAIWLWSRRGAIATVLKLGALALAAWLLWLPAMEPGPATQASVGSAEVWSEEKVAELRAQGQTIFVDFTADWCLTCKVNERVALKTEAVQKAFRERGVAFLVADWTRNDPAITRVLEQHQRPGVPLYLVYVNGGEPKLLPQVLTPQIVIDSLDP